MLKSISVTSELLPAIGVNLVLALLAARGGGVRLSGVFGGLLVGIPICVFLGWQGFAVLVALFLIGTVLTRVGYARKSALGVAEDRGGARGASHALANAGIAALASFGAWFTGNPLWALAFTAALATATMDTAGSEIGPLYGRRTISLRTFREVPPGTDGAVSLEGTLAGLAAASILAVVALAGGLVSGLGVVWVLAGALAGNLYEGILGSRKLLPHTWLNATNTLVGALVAFLLAFRAGS